MSRTITLNLDLDTARLVRDSLASRTRFYGLSTTGYEHCEALRQYLDEEIQHLLYGVVPDPGPDGVIMAEKPEARIIVKPGPEGRREISCYDPVTGRESATGLRGGDQEIRQIKETLERAGNRVTVKEC